MSLHLHHYSLYDDTIIDYKEFLIRAINESMRVSKKYVFFNIQKNYYNKKEVFEVIGHFSKYILDIVIWEKSNPMPASGMNITNSYEFILVLSDKVNSLQSLRTYTKNHFTTNVYSNNPYTKQHRAVMHPEVCDYVFERFFESGETILDPFMGLGTTAIACMERGIKYIGFELVSEYIDIAQDRLKKVNLS